MSALSDPRREKACQARASGKTQEASYTEGGYSYKPASATRFFRLPEIAARISEIHTDRLRLEQRSTEIAAKKVAVDKEWVLQRLMYNAEQSLRGRPMRNGKGEVIAGMFTQPNESAANRALELIGNHLGMFIQRHEIGQPGDFQRMSDDELNESLTVQARALGLPETAIVRLLELRSDTDSVQ